MHIRIVLLVVAVTTTLAACGDQVRQAKIAAQLRAQLIATLERLEARRAIPGLQHRHVTIEPDSGGEGFTVKIYDLKLGGAEIGFQSFTLMNFGLAADGAHFAARNFRFAPKAISQAPDSAPGMLIAALTAWAPAIQISD
jgi:hypothetical protein